MPTFDIHCVQVDKEVRIDFEGEDVRGSLRFRGFICEHEGDCHAAGLKCALFDAEGIEPFDPGDAFEFFNS